MVQPRQGLVALFGCHMQLPGQPGNVDGFPYMAVYRAIPYPSVLFWGDFPARMLLL